MRPDMGVDGKEDDAQADQQRAHLPVENARRGLSYAVLNRRQEAVYLGLGNDDAERHRLPGDAAAVPQVGGAHPLLDDEVRCFLPVLIQRHVLDRHVRPCRQLQRRHGGLRAVAERAVDAGDTLSVDVAGDEAERSFSHLVRGHDVAVRHHEKAEPGVRQGHALDQGGQLFQGDVHGDHAGHVGAVGGPQRVEVADDQRTGDRVDVGFGRHDVGVDRPARRILQPRLPSLVDAGEEEVPEIRPFVVASVQLVEHLRLLRPRSGPQNRRVFRPDIVDLQLRGAGPHDGRPHDVEEPAVADLPDRVRHRVPVLVEQIAPDADRGRHSGRILRPSAGLVVD